MPESFISLPLYSDLSPGFASLFIFQLESELLWSSSSRTALESLQTVRVIPADPVPARFSSLEPNATNRAFPNRSHSSTQHKSAYPSQESTRLHIYQPKRSTPRCLTQTPGFANRRRQLPFQHWCSSWFLLSSAARPNPMPWSSPW